MANSRYGRGSNQYAKKAADERFVDRETLDRLPESAQSPVLQTGGHKDPELLAEVARIKSDADAECAWLPDDFVAEVRCTEPSLPPEASVEAATATMVRDGRLGGSIVAASRRREDMLAVLGTVSSEVDRQNLEMLRRIGI